MKQRSKSIGHLVGAGLMTTLSAGNVGATENPFAIQEVGKTETIRVAEAAPEQTDPNSQAGNAAAKMKESGEMKCGAQMMKKDAKVPDPKAAAGAGTKMDGAAPVAPAAPK